MAGTIPLAGSAAVGGRLLRKGHREGEEDGRIVEEGAKATQTFKNPADGAGWLVSQEIDGSHTVLEHVGKSSGELLDRLTRPGSAITGSSSFASIEDAEVFIEQAIGRRAAKVASFLNNPEQFRTSIQVDLGTAVGGASASRTTGCAR